MNGAIELFSLPDGNLVFSSGHSSRALIDPMRERDFICIRRYGRGTIPRAKIISFPLAEFLNWYYHGVSFAEAFSSLSRSDFAFISGETEE